MLNFFVVGLAFLGYRSYEDGVDVVFGSAPVSEFKEGKSIEISTFSTVYTRCSPNECKLDKSAVCAIVGRLHGEEVVALNGRLFA